MPLRYFAAAMSFASLLAVLVWLGFPDEPTREPESPTVSLPTPPSALPRTDRPAKAVSVPVPPAEPTEVVPFPADIGGEAVARVVAPAAPPPPALPAEVLTGGPLSRATPAWLSGPIPGGRASYPLPPVMLSHPASLRLAAPPELVPVALTAWAGEAPARPVLPAGPKMKVARRDAAVPPPPPVLARPPLGRGPFDDPTVEAGNDALVARPLVLDVVAAAFVRVSLPDPFALAEQVRAKLAVEPGLTPVPVNPKRPR